jgi:hypothetical protein
LQESLGKFDHIAATHPGPEKDRQNFGIRERINAALEELFARLLVLG